MASELFFDDDLCRDCGLETVADTRTGRCGRCQRRADERNRKARERRAAFRDAMDSVGVKRVRGENGGTYYE
jgi:hypothetical protein